jgi:hypothetical protein
MGHLNRMTLQRSEMDSQGQIAPNLSLTLTLNELYYSMTPKNLQVLLKHFFTITVKDI